MNTEHSFLYLFLLMYMLLNVYTDLTSMKTKNWLHLFSLGSVLFYGLWYGIIVGVLYSSVLGLLVGIALSIIPKAKLGAGDIKMLMVIFPFIGSDFGFNHFNIYILFIFLYLVTSIIIITTLKVIKSKTSKASFHFYSYEVTKDGAILAPEAIPLFIACIVLPILN